MKGKWVRLWNPGTIEHGLKALVDEVEMRREGGFCKAHPEKGWHDDVGRTFFGGWKPMEMCVSFEEYKRRREETKRQRRKQYGSYYDQSD